MGTHFEVMRIVDISKCHNPKVLLDTSLAEVAGIDQWILQDSNVPIYNRDSSLYDHALVKQMERFSGMQFVHYLCYEDVLTKQKLDPLKYELMGEYDSDYAMTHYLTLDDTKDKLFWVSLEDGSKVEVTKRNNGVMLAMQCLALSYKDTEGNNLRTYSAKGMTDPEQLTLILPEGETLTEAQYQRATKVVRNCYTQDNLFIIQRLFPAMHAIQQLVLAENEVLYVNY